MLAANNRSALLHCCTFSDFKSRACDRVSLCGCQGNAGEAAVIVEKTGRSGSRVRRAAWADGRVERQTPRPASPASADVRGEGASAGVAR